MIMIRNDIVLFRSRKDLIDNIQHNAINIVTDSYTFNGTDFEFRFNKRINCLHYPVMFIRCEPEGDDFSGFWREIDMNEIRRAILR